MEDAIISEVEGELENNNSNIEQPTTPSMTTNSVMNKTDKSKSKVKKIKSSAVNRKMPYSNPVKKQSKDSRLYYHPINSESSSNRSNNNRC